MPERFASQLCSTVPNESSGKFFAFNVIANLITSRTNAVIDGDSFQVVKLWQRHVIVDDFQGFAEKYSIHISLIFAESIFVENAPRSRAMAAFGERLAERERERTKTYIWKTTVSTKARPLQPTLKRRFQ